MSDAIFIVTALLPEFAGPVLPAGLLIWGIRKFMRVRRLRRSLMATKGDAAARQMEYDRIGAGVISFWGSVWRSDPVWLTASEKSVQPGFQGKGGPGRTGKDL